MAYQIGDHVGDYEVIGILGAGGMGKVYQVKNLLTHRVEAMKVLLPNLTDNAEIADRFLREIRVLASLEHPNIAELRTAQHIDNQVLMVMECIEGKSLDELMHRGTLKREFGLNFIAQALSAIDYAHSNGIIHRDIKPANIMVTPSGQVKLMDFGIAKLAADRRLTASGSTLGSLYYMSPEQIQGADAVDARSDIYSVGICLYEVSTGKRPFDATSEYSLMSAHLNQAPRPPIQIDDTIPESLNQIILMAIAKDPAQRFQSAKAMLAALNSVRQELGIESASQPVIAMAPEAVAAPNVSPRADARPPKSRRGLYMALGSIATAGALVAALLIAPGYFRSTATSTKTPQPVTQTTPATSAPAAPLVNPDPAPAQPAAEPAPQPSAGGTAAIVKPSASAPHHSAEPVSTAASAVPAQTAPLPVQQPAAAQSTQPPASSPPPAQHQQPPSPHTPAPNAAALNEVREQYNQLAVRATSAKAGLDSLQSQMGGMGLRADMRETAVRMDYLMKEAMSSLRAGDADAARRNLDLADRAVERLEKFLGR